MYWPSPEHTFLFVSAMQTIFLIYFADGESSQLLTTFAFILFLQYETMNRTSNEPGSPTNDQPNVNGANSPVTVNRIYEPLKVNLKFPENASDVDCPECKPPLTVYRKYEPVRVNLHSFDNASNVDCQDCKPPITAFRGYEPIKINLKFFENSSNVDSPTCNVDPDSNSESAQISVTPTVIQRSYEPIRIRLQFSDRDENLDSDASSASDEHVVTLDETEPTSDHGSETFWASNRAKFLSPRNSCDNVNTESEPARNLDLEGLEPLPPSRKRRRYRKKSKRERKQQIAKQPTQ